MPEWRRSAGVGFSGQCFFGYFWPKQKKHIDPLLNIKLYRIYTWVQISGTSRGLYISGAFYISVKNPAFSEKNKDIQKIRASRTIYHENKSILYRNWIVFRKIYKNIQFRIFPLKVPMSLIMWVIFCGSAGRGRIWYLSKITCTIRGIHIWGWVFDLGIWPFNAIIRNYIMVHSFKLRSWFNGIKKKLSDWMYFSGFWVMDCGQVWWMQTAP